MKHLLTFLWGIMIMQNVDSANSNSLVGGTAENVENSIIMAQLFK
ncbi:hypothetical protein ACVNPX_05150 [Staphylococcus aureus]